MQRTNFTPKQSVIRFCQQCIGGKLPDISQCKGDKLLSGGKCPFYPYRLGKGRPGISKIREMCLQCMNGSRQGITDCPTITCPLYKYRLGTNPNRVKSIR